MLITFPAIVPYSDYNKPPMTKDTSSSTCILGLSVEGNIVSIINSSSLLVIVPIKLPSCSTIPEVNGVFK